jgi:glycosyltransferase involved in cell wall biosynthesis
MRVLWVYDGLSAHHVKLATCLAHRDDMSLEVICRWEGQPPLDRSLIPLTNMTCKSKVDFASRQTLRTRLQTGRFDVVSVYTSRALANVLAACRGVRNAPKVIGYRGTTNRLHVLDPANWITFWHPRLSKIVCVSHATNLALRKSGLRGSKMATVWEGCCLDRKKAFPRSALAEFDIPADAFVVGLVANMRPVKGVDLLLKAALQLADLKNVYWLLIGDVQDPNIRELAKHPGIAKRVRMPGPRSHGGQYASLFDIYASPSRMEGMPMSIMEAMTHAVCPVTTDVGGCTELVRDHQDGLVVPSEDPTAMATAIRFLHDSPQRRDAFATSAQLRATTEFSVEAWADRLYDVYAEVTGAQLARAA